MGLDLAELPERGTKMPDEDAAGLVEGVGTVRLDFRSPAGCVLGRVLGNHATGEEGLGIEDDDPCGFIHPERHAPRGYEDPVILTELDRQRVGHVQRRRAARSLVPEAKKFLASIWAPGS